MKTYGQDTRMLCSTCKGAGKRWRYDYRLGHWAYTRCLTCGGNGQIETSLIGWSEEDD